MKEVPRGASFKKSDLSLVHIFFEDLKVFKYHTDELFSWENILGEISGICLGIQIATNFGRRCRSQFPPPHAASFGGLIGLCTGFSFLSLAELAYFFTLRCTMPICRKRRRRDKVAMLAAATTPASSASSGGRAEQTSGRGVRCNESDLVVVKMGDC